MCNLHVEQVKMAEEGSMESVIDRLVGENGYAAVYSYIMERMKSDYEFMGGVFGAVKEEVKVVAPLKEKKLVVKKKAVVIAEGEAEAVAAVVPGENTIGIVSVVAAAVVPAAPVEEKKKEEGVELPLEGEAPEQSLSTKQRQKLDQVQTRARLDKEGKTVEMMLSVENMKEWIAAGKSYAYIASKLVGCPQKLVSDFAKANDLKSPYEGKTGVAIGMKK
jgi:hypothetical protein